ncbi:MAG: HEAT repeat domain-containing protein, partial [Alphaproteobacteria bacterium]
LAAQALGHLHQQHPDIVGALIDALLDEDEDVRSDAASALAGLADPRSAPQLFDNLIGDPNAEVKGAALDVLIRMNHPEIAGWLRRLLKGRDPEIVWDEDAFYTDEWDDWTDIQLRALKGLGELGLEDSVPDIAAAIDDEMGQDLIVPAFATLATLGQPGIAALAGYLESGGPKQRRRAASALGSTETGAASPAMDRALDDPSEEVRLAAARVLARRDPADPRLRRLFQDGIAELRAEAVRICGQAHADQVQSLLDDRSPAVRTAVYSLLCEAPHVLPAESVLQTLLSGLQETDGALAILAANALAAVAPTEAIDELSRLVADESRAGDVRAGAAKALAGIKGAGIENTLVAVIGEPDRSLRLAALSGLLGIARARDDWPNVAGDALIAALRGELVAEPEPEPEADPLPEPAPQVEPQVEVREPTSTLEAILGGDAIPPGPDEDPGAPVELTEQDFERLALAERIPRKQRVSANPKLAPYSDVRRIAARLLGDLPHQDIACALAEALESDDAEMRLPAADSLARIAVDSSALPEDAMLILTATLDGKDREIQLCAIRALGAAGGPEAIDLVRTLLTHEDSFIRTGAVRALSGRDCLGPEVATLLSDPDRSVRLAAAEATAAAGGEDALDCLFEFAFAANGEHSSEAGRLLRAIDAPGASGRFLDVLADTGRLKELPVAIEALVQLNRPEPMEITRGDLQS